MSEVRTVLLKDICNFEKGSTGLMKAVPGEYPLVTTGKDNRSCESYQFDTKAVCIPLVSSTGHGHASLNNVHYQEGKFALGTILVAITAKNDAELDVHFLHLYLSQLKDVVLVPLMKGAANVSLSITSIKGIEIPLPSFARQQEIVDKFKSVAMEEKLLLEEMYHQKVLLEKLREQLLQDAITGKLTDKERQQNTFQKTTVDYRTNDEQGRTSTHVTSKENLLELPNNWVWAQVSELFKFIDYRGKTPTKLKSGIRLITAKNVKKGNLSLDPEDFISLEEYQERMTRGFPAIGDILFTTEAPLGNICLLDIEEQSISTGQRLITLQKKHSEINNKLIMFFILSPLYQKYLYENSTGVTAKGIKAGKLKEMLVPLPPISEQNLIVNKLEYCFSLCEELSKRFKRNDEHAKLLIRTVLREEFSRNNEIR